MCNKWKHDLQVTNLTQKLQRESIYLSEHPRVCQKKLKRFFTYYINNLYNFILILLKDHLNLHQDGWIIPWEWHQNSREQTYIHLKWRGGKTPIQSLGTGGATKDGITIYINCNNLFIFRYLFNIYYLLYLLILSIIIIFIYLLLFILDRGAYAEKIDYCSNTASQAILLWRIWIRTESWQRENEKNLAPQ